MKKVLLATTILVAGASVAAAEVTLSGDARMGIVKGFDSASTLQIDESETTFTSRARVSFGLSGESDSGLSFGASFRADNASGAASGTAGSVFVKGAFGKLTLGDVDGAAQAATGNVSGVGLTGLGDLNESTFIGAGSGATDPTALYEYSAGSFTVFVSATNPVAVVGADPVAATATTAGVAAKAGQDLQALAIGGKYTFGDYTVGVGYENQKGFINTAPGLAGPATGADNTDIKHIVLKLSANVAGFTVQGLWGQADGTKAGAVVAKGEQYAASVSYTANALTGTVFYADDSAAVFGGATAYGIGASYDLGGGAKVVGGYAKNVDSKKSSYDVGVSLSF